MLRSFLAHVASEACGPLINLSIKIDEMYDDRPMMWRWLLASLDELTRSCLGRYPSLSHGWVGTWATEKSTWSLLWLQHGKRDDDDVLNEDWIIYRMVRSRRRGMMMMY
jgi:hypothetical protein